MNYFEIETYGTATKYRCSRNMLRAIWFVFWIAIPIPVVTATIASMAGKVFKKDFLYIKRSE